MVLVRPVTKTIISTTEFGQPVYDFVTGKMIYGRVNLTNGTSVPNTQAEFLLPMDSTKFLGNGMSISVGALALPTIGVYKLTSTYVFGNAAEGGAYMSLNAYIGSTSVATSVSGRTGYWMGIAMVGMFRITNGSILTIRASTDIPGPTGGSIWVDGRSQVVVEWMGA